MTRKQICKLFGVSMSQLKTQYKANAEVLAGMRDKAVRTGRNVNNYTSKQLTGMTKQYINLSK